MSLVLHLGTALQCACTDVNRALCAVQVSVQLWWRCNMSVIASLLEACLPVMSVWCTALTTMAIHVLCLPCRYRRWCDYWPKALILSTTNVRYVTTLYCDVIESSICKALSTSSDQVLRTARWLVWCVGGCRCRGVHSTVHECTLVLYDIWSIYTFIATCCCKIFNELLIVRHLCVWIRSRVRDELSSFGFCCSCQLLENRPLTWRAHDLHESYMFNMQSRCLSLFTAPSILCQSTTRYVTCYRSSIVLLS